MPTNQHIFSVSLAKQVLELESVERRRAEAYAAAVGSLTMLVITRDETIGTEPQTIGKLTLIPVSARTKISRFFIALQAGKRYLHSHSDRSWQVTAQDAFETGLLAYLLSRSINVRFHLQVHGDPFGNPHWRKESFLNPLRLWLGKRLLRKAEKIRVVSERTANSIKALGVSETAIFILPIRPDLARFFAVGEARTYRDQATFTFVYVGRFAPEKNLPWLIQNFARAQTQQPGLRLKLVGDGPEAARLRALVHQLDLDQVVTFAAWSDDIPKVLSTVDALVLTSKHEGYALVLVEAMAAALPVVTTDVGCVGEVVKDGEHGTVVPFNDDAALTQALARFAADPEKAFAQGQAAYKTMLLQQMSEAQYIEQWTESFYDA